MHQKSSMKQKNGSHESRKKPAVEAGSMTHRSVLVSLALAVFALVGCGDNSKDEVLSGCSNDSTCAVFALVNEERAEAGVEPLAYSGELQLAAQLHAEDMEANGYFSHDSLDGRNFVTRANDAGYAGQPSAENIAAGQQTPEQVMNSWMNSNGHRRNILSAGSNEIGIGRAGNMWVQKFGNRR
jgi:uncharacterized protein YkwD